MPDYNYLLATVVNLVAQHQGEILTFVLSGTSVSIVLQLIKHFGKLQDAKKLVMFLLGALSVFASFADQLFAFAGQNNSSLLLHNLGWVITVAVFAHRFCVSPVYYKVTNFLNGVYADAQAYRAEQAQLAAATVPVADAPTQPGVPADASQHEFTIPQ